MVPHTWHLTPINDDYETCERTFAELRIYGDNLDPASVTVCLHIRPTSSQKKGQIRRGHGGRKSEVKTGGWFFSSERHVKSKDIRSHLDWLLGKLIRAKDQLLALQQEKGIMMGVNCVWWSAHGDGGPTLWPEQMRLLSELNLECSFDISFFGDSDQEEV